MSRRVLILNVVLGIVCVALAAGVIRTLAMRRPPPPPAASRVVSTPPPAATLRSADPGLASYSVIAARNLFNPSRSETAVALAPVNKPILHGVVIDGPKSRAYLEDPADKRVAGYSVGDTIGGGRIRRITDDKVVIARPEGLLEVLLQDPSKPRPAPGGGPAGPAAAVTGPQAPTGPQPPPGVQGPTFQGPTSPQGPVIGPPPTPGSPPLRRRVPAQGQGND